MTPTFDPKLDLTFERFVDVPPALIWKAWTQPEHLMPWFCPLPWKTIHAEIDLRPGGIFHTVMQSPEGQTFPNIGCYLEVIENERLTWTNALLPGFRPSRLHQDEETGAFFFTATVELFPHGDGGTRYVATVHHEDEAGCEKHRAMGYEQGWGMALEQLVAYVKTW
ncbi:SRPBCC family protein [Ferriphaselus sp. R-1]|uniref:SRPBCC family protein n=1 Tax=Ferriphaselus sp. R-1 TaxID=1485544 RepID=UPI000551F22C|nr:SRPBCC family protein [Ferriphaselus sp. R-1]